MALFESYLNSPFKTAWEIDYVQKFIDRGVRLPRENMANLLFLHGVNMLNNIIKEEAVAPIWRCEDITRDSAALIRLSGNSPAVMCWSNRNGRACRSPTTDQHPLQRECAARIRGVANRSHNKNR